MLAAALVVGLGGCASTPVGRAAGLRRLPSTSAPPATTTSTTDPGALPETGVLPPADDPQFDRAMGALWQGVVDDSVPTAMPAFFPERAYLQVKTVEDPAADFSGRLLSEFAADLGAAHALLGPGASTATLETVEVPEQYAHWVPPGVCANRVGYYEVADARLVYRQAGVVRSFGIASLISWRGEWYVVHLGAVVRSGAGGEVDDPETGPGSAPPSTTC